MPASDPCPPAERACPAAQLGGRVTGNGCSAATAFWLKESYNFALLLKTFLWSYFVLVTYARAL